MLIPIFAPSVWALVLTAALAVLPAWAQTDAVSHPAILAGHVVMPAKLFIPAPKDAPQSPILT